MNQTTDTRNAFQTTDTSSLVKKVDYGTKTDEIVKAITDHNQSNKEFKNYY